MSDPNAPNVVAEKSVSPEIVPEPSTINANAPQVLVSDRFPEYPQYHHIWATIIFIFHIGGYLLVQFLVLPEVIEYLHYGHYEDTPFLQNLTPLFALLTALGSSVVVSILYLLLIQALPVFTFWLTVICFNGLLIIALVFFVLWRYIVPAVMAGLIFLIGLFVVLRYRKRIGFDAYLLHVITKIMCKYGGLRMAVFVSIFLQMLWLLSVALTIAGIVLNGYYIALPYVVISFLWTTAVIKNVVQLTASRAFCMYYFLMGTRFYPTDHRITAMSWKHALLSGFGPVCYGSMFIPLFHLVLGYNDGGTIDHHGSRNDGCCGWKDVILSKFNWYAWAHVATYGKSIGDASRDTWSMIIHHGVDTIIKPSVINYYIKLIWTVVGLLTALATSVFTKVVMTWLPPWIVMLYIGFAFVIGATIASVTTVLLDAGLSSTGVVLSEESKSIQRVESELFEQVWEIWPEVVSST